MRNSNVVVRDNISSLSRQATLKIKVDGSGVVSLTFFDFSSLCFLVCLEKPLEVVIFELSHVLVLELLSNLDAFVPSVELLVHSHGLLDLVILDEDSFGLVELFL